MKPLPDRIKCAGPFLIVLILTLNAFYISMARSVAGQSFVLPAADFTFRPWESALVSGPASSVLYLVLLLIGAGLATAFNRRFCLAFSGGAYLAGSLALWTASGSWMIVVGLSLEMAAEAFIVIAALSLIADAVPVGRRPFAYGVYAAGVLLSFPAGAFVAMWVDSAFGWRLSVILLVAAYLPLLFFTMWSVRDGRSPVRGRLRPWIVLRTLAGKPSFLLLVAAACLYVGGSMAVGAAKLPFIFARYDYSASDAAALLALVNGVGIPLAVLGVGLILQIARTTDAATPFLVTGSLATVSGLLVFVATAEGGTFGLLCLLAGIVIAPTVNPLFLFGVQEVLPQSFQPIGLALLIAAQVLFAIIAGTLTATSGDIPAPASLANASSDANSLTVAAAAWLLSAILYVAAGRFVKADAVQQLSPSVGFGKVAHV